MSRFIIIISTLINTPYDLEHISSTVGKFAGVIDWTIDLGDSDKVLRLSASNNISTELTARFHQLGITAAVMGVFID